MKRVLSILVAVSLSLCIYPSEYQYKFRLYLKDKLGSSYSVDKPEEFLSIKAVERRNKQQIKVNESDLPIVDSYLKKIENIGGKIVAKSKWNNTVAVHVEDSAQIEKFKNLDFVIDTKLVWRGKPKEVIAEPDTIVSYPIDLDPKEDNFYGYAYDNIKMLKGDTLHARGYMGEGMTIGVIDAGFNNYPKIEFLDNINLIGYKNFVQENESLFKQENQHGLNVISCIATNKPNLFVGTAPHADFWMLGTEDSSSEYPIEEDYWAEAIEFADSVGVDVINTSLGYTDFDYPAESYTRATLDGKTAMISKSAGLAAKKGMFLVISAGNSGNKSWGKVSAPADAHDVLTVGAVARDSIIAPFSSRGLTADLRIKPDVVALGSFSMVIEDEGRVALKSGTSFSSPIMCGMVACLWQAFPTLTNYELLEIIREAGDRYDDPSSIYGFGIPDMEKAMDLAQREVDRKERLKKLNK